MKIVIIAAVSENGVIGQAGKIPWHIPEDLARFRKLTEDQAVVMGRKTWESLPKRSRPLPDRENIVLTRGGIQELIRGAWRASDVESALECARDLKAEKLYVIGGRQVYEAFIPLADRIEMTVVNQKVEADDPDTRVMFPVPDNSWGLIKQENHSGFSFETYERVARKKEKV